MERLSGMTLKDHESIDASTKAGETSVAEVATGQSGASSDVSAFALPEKLRQHFVLVPCKLRLVTLAAFVLWKCKVFIQSLISSY